MSGLGLEEPGLRSVGQSGMDDGLPYDEDYGQAGVDHDDYMAGAGTGAGAGAEAEGEAEGDAGQRQGHRDVPLHLATSLDMEPGHQDLVPSDTEAKQSAKRKRKCVKLSFFRFPAFPPSHPPRTPVTCAPVEAWFLFFSPPLLSAHTAAVPILVQGHRPPARQGLGAEQRRDEAEPFGHKWHRPQAT
jgi:hypothetical protein